MGCHFTHKIDSLHCKGNFSINAATGFCRFDARFCNGQWNTVAQCGVFSVTGKGWQKGVGKPNPAQPEQPLQPSLSQSPHSLVAIMLGFCVTPQYEIFRLEQWAPKQRRIRSVVHCMEKLVRLVGVSQTLALLSYVSANYGIR